MSLCFIKGASNFDYILREFYLYLSNRAVACFGSAFVRASVNGFDLSGQLLFNRLTCLIVLNKMLTLWRWSVVRKTH